MAVVAIAQQIGSRGLELGGLVAAKLRYPLLGPEELAADLARDYKITPELLSLFDERQPGWWERLTTDNARLAAYFRAVILKHMSLCNAVVVGRSTPFMLPSDTRHGLRIRAVAPLGARVREVMRDEKLDAVAAPQAVRLVGIVHWRGIGDIGQHVQVVVIPTDFEARFETTGIGAADQTAS